MNKKVVVGISGGVDSSVAALLLKNKGYEVIGVTFVFTDDFDSKDARLVCEKLGIKHHILDYKKEFKEKVIDKFIDDYKKGITPNPCIMCNRYVKFKFLYDAMIKYNANYIATGHYAKVVDNHLYKSSDLNKDQTYFLCELTKEEVSKVLFPLEGIEKDKVRKIASDAGLVNANKKDSTDVCFITSNFKSYINNVIKDKKGDVIEITSMKKIGEHSGLSRFTIGQRRGLNISSSDRIFVVGKDVTKNILYVAGGSNTDYLLSDACILDNVNLFSDDIKSDNLTAKFRYRQKEVPVKVDKINDKLLVKYDNVKSVTPGQICAIYNGDELIGGGIIKEVMKDGKKLWYL